MLYSYFFLFGCGMSVWLLLLLCVLWAYICWTQLHLLLIWVDYRVFFHVCMGLAGSEYLRRHWWQRQRRNIPERGHAHFSNRDGCNETVLVTDRAHNTREAPLCAEESVTVQASLIVQVAFKYVHSDNVRVHGIGVLPHGGLDHWLPWVTACKDTEEGRQTACALSKVIVTTGVKVIRKRSSWWGSWLLPRH